jgi:hypothetical protein
MTCELVRIKTPKTPPSSILTLFNVCNQIRESRVYQIALDIYISRGEMPFILCLL